MIDFSIQRFVQYEEKFICLHIEVGKHTGMVMQPNLSKNSHLFFRMGAGQKNYEELAQEMEMYTGGLGVSTHLVSHHTETDQFELVGIACMILFFTDFLFPE